MNDPRPVRPEWHAVYTRSRHEKKVAAGLEDRGFGVYLPLVPRESQWHDRKKLVYWPLFPGYVFVRFAGADVAAVLGMPGVASVVSVNSRPAPIPEADIENVRALAAAIAETGSVPVPETLVARGQAVRVHDGPFAGVRGLVLEQRGDRAILQVGLEAIRQAVRLEVEAARLRPLHGTRPQ